MKKIFTIIIVSFFFGCTKKLDLKPQSSLVLPKTVQDFENLLDNTSIMNTSPGLLQLSADEYHVPSTTSYNSLTNTTVRNAYLWKPDIFEGQTKIPDWINPYAQIFYCNSVLDVIDELDIEADPELQRVKGWALFARAYGYYNLVSTFSKAYDQNTANTDLGVPLKINSSVTENVGRSTLQESYDRIVKDALEASELLQREIPLDKKNRPSKVAAYAFLARVFISMRKYEQAETYADKAMAIYSTLTDFNSLPRSTTASSFTYNSEETIYFVNMTTSSYSTTAYATGALYGIEPSIISQYHPNDLRKTIYFGQNANGNFYSKGINNAGRLPFTGLATDELYLIKAECLARRAQYTEAMSFLNQLLVKRWNPNGTTPAVPYSDLTASNASEALDKILIERKKNLIWRSIRWTDLKRLNLEGRNIILTRTLGTTVYTLEPNSPRYILPIPDDEVSLSGIQQNIR